MPKEPQTTFHAKARNIFDRIVTAKPGNYSVLNKKQAIEILESGLASSYEDGQTDLAEWQNAEMKDGK